MGWIFILVSLCSQSAIAQQQAIPLQRIDLRPFLASPQSDYADLDLNGTPDAIVGNGFLSMPGLGAVMASLREPGGQQRTLMSGPALGFEVVTRVKALQAGNDLFPSVLLATGNGKLRLAPSTKPHERGMPNGVFQFPVLIEDLYQSYQLQSLFSFVHTTFLDVRDLDGDGFQDVIWSGSIGDLWAGTSAPAGVRVYLGSPTGGLLAPIVIPLFGGTLSASFADFDRDGRDEALCLLTEMVSLSSYSIQVETLHIQGRQLRLAGRQQLPFAGRATGMDIGDLNGDQVPDFVIAGVTGFGPTQTADLWVIEGKIDGTFLNSGTQLSLPNPPANMHEFVDVKIVNLDRDRDSNQRPLNDVVALWAFGNSSIDPPGELVWFRGFESGGRHILQPGLSKQLEAPLNATNRNMSVWNQAPMLTHPGVLNFHDFDLDDVPDLVLTGLYVANSGGMSPSVSSYKNQTRLQPPFEKGIKFLGTPSEGTGGFRPRAGVTGGAPVPGNPNFGLTLIQAKGDGTPATLFWGGLKHEYTLFNELNFQFIVNPAWMASPISTAGVGAGNGWAVKRVGIPNDPSLIGIKAYFAWAVHDSIPTRFIPLTLSDAVEVQIGKPY